MSKKTPKKFVIQVKSTGTSDWGTSYWASNTYNLEDAKLLQQKLENAFGFETRLMVEEINLTEVK